MTTPNPYRDPQDRRPDPGPVVQATGFRWALNTREPCASADVARALEAERNHWLATVGTVAVDPTNAARRLYHEESGLVLAQMDRAIAAVAALVAGELHMVLVSLSGETTGRMAITYDRVLPETLAAEEPQRRPLFVGNVSDPSALITQPGRPETGP